MTVILHCNPPCCCHTINPLQTDVYKSHTITGTGRQRRQRLSSIPKSCCNNHVHSNQRKTMEPIIQSIIQSTITWNKTRQRRSAIFKGGNTGKYMQQLPPSEADENLLVMMLRWIIRCWIHWWLWKMSNMAKMDRIKQFQQGLALSLPECNTLLDRLFWMYQAG